MGGLVLYIDAEHALDTAYAGVCGVDVNTLKGAQPGTGEEALDIAERMVRTHALDVVVIDSVAALVPRAEIEGEMGESHVGLQARLMSQALRKLTGEISKSNTSVVFINQLREKVGVIFGSPEVTPGGRALKFYSSVRIDLRKADAIKNGAEIIGNRVRAKVVKNKMAAPYRVAEFDIMFNSGISKEGDVIDLGVSTGIIKKSGAFFDFNGTKMGQGREKAREFLTQHPEITIELEKQIRNIALSPRASGDGKEVAE
jgi:recombination protein RecA